MKRTVSNNPLVRQLASGQVKENLYQLIIDRELSFTDEEYLECMGILRSHPPLAEKAEKIIMGLPDSVKENYTGRSEASVDLVAFLLEQALKTDKQTLVTKVIHNQFLPVELLEMVAQRGNRLMLEHLLDNQIKLIAFPVLIAQIEANPSADNFIRSRLVEMKSYYLDNQTPGAQISEADAAEVVQEVKKQHQSLTKAGDQEEENEEELVFDTKETLSTLQRINQLSTAERVKLAVTGTKTERTLLLRDPNKMVAMAVIESPKIGIDEVATLLRNRSVAGEIISKIADNREWTKNYSICYELAVNPKTPVSKAMGFIKKLRENDLRLIYRDRNVSPVIRQVAQNVINTKK